MNYISRFCVIVVFAFFAGLAQAQSAPTTDELRALRFYIEQENSASTQAEIRRLQAIYPGWTPPATLTDLLQIQPGPELANIYARIERNDIAGANGYLQKQEPHFPHGHRRII